MPVLTRSQTRLITKRSNIVIKTITDILNQNAILTNMLNYSTSSDETNELLQMMQTNENMLRQLNDIHPLVLRYVLCDQLNLEKYYNKLFQ